MSDVVLVQLIKVRENSLTFAVVSNTYRSNEIKHTHMIVVEYYFQYMFNLTVQSMHARSNSTLKAWTWLAEFMASHVKLI